jgi:hypothetical protein
MTTEGREKVGEEYDDKEGRAGNLIQYNMRRVQNEFKLCPKERV